MLDVRLTDPETEFNRTLLTCNFNSRRVFITDMSTTSTRWRCQLRCFGSGTRKAFSAELFSSAPSPQ